SFSDIFGDVFGDIFGGGGGRGRSTRGSDLRYTLELDLEEAVKGKTVKITIPGHKECDVCDGSGAEKGSRPETCSPCQGMGQVGPPVICMCRWPCVSTLSLPVMVATSTAKSPSASLMQPWVANWKCRHLMVG